MVLLFLLIVTVLIVSRAVEGYLHTPFFVPRALHNANGLYSSSGSSNTYGANDDVRHLKREFAELARGGDSISLDTLLRWEEIQALVVDNLVSTDEVKQLWGKNLPAGKEEIDVAAFISINKALDDLFDDESDAIDDEDAMPSLGFVAASDLVARDNVGDNSLNVIDGDMEGFDIWDPEVASTGLFDKAFNKYLEKFFTENKSPSNGLLSYQKFFMWPDVRQILTEGSMDVSCLEDIWAEALMFKHPSDPSAGVSRDWTMKGGKDGMSGDDESSYMVDLDTFYRVNFRLEEVMDEIKDAMEGLTEEQVEEFYRLEFATLARGEPFITFPQLLDWSMVQELIADEGVTLQTIEELWAALPKIKLEVEGKGFGSPSQGIGVDAFVAFNTAIEDYISTFDAGEL